MFARANIAAASLANAKIVENNTKTDDELMKEIELEAAEEDDEAADRKNELLYKKQFEGSSILETYGTFCFFCLQLVHGKYEAPFNMLIISVICLAGMLVGIETYPEFEDNEIITNLDTFVVSIFALEIFVKIVAEGTKPWRFVMGPNGSWNFVDFFIVLVCMPKISDIFGNSSPTVRLVSRLFRLMRVGKIIQQIPALQVIVRGLIGGLKSIGYVAILLIIIFYLWGVFGVYLFCDNDPFYFRDVETALVTLFRICTLEGWSDIMYINFYGCDKYTGGIYESMELEDMDSWNSLPHMYRCTKPLAQPELAGAFFISFTLISSLVMLSLFVGVITMSMQESLGEMRKDAEEQSRKKVLMKQLKEMKALAKSQAALAFTRQLAHATHHHRRHSSVDNPDDGKKPPYKHHNSSDDSESDGSSSEDEALGLFGRIKKFSNHFRGSRRNADGTVVKYMTHKEKRKMKDMTEMKSLLMQAWAGTNTFKTYHAEMDVQQDGTIMKYIRWAGVYSRHLIEHKFFQNFITFIILCTAVLVGLQANNQNPDQPTQTAFDACEDILFSIFVIELVLRMAAEEFHWQEYFSNTWNIFDFFVVMVSKVPGVGVFTIILRLVRLLRVLKLVKFLPQLAVIVNALLMALSSIGYILTIMLLTFYMFAVLGIIAFRDNDGSNFGTLNVALVSLYRIATLDNWGGVMYKNIYGCDVYPPPDSQSPSEQSYCVTPAPMHGWSVLFFIVFIVIGSLVMITLFVGVVTTSMEEATRLQIVEFELEKSIKEVCNEKAISQEQLDIYRRVFSMLDLDGGGTIEPSELRIGLKCININPTEKQMKKWVLEVDVNFDGVIDIVEFIIFMTNMKKKNMEARERQLMRAGANAFFRLRDKGRATRLKELEEGGGLESVPSLGAKPQLQQRGSMFGGLMAGDDRKGSTVPLNASSTLGVLRRTGSTIINIGTSSITSAAHTINEGRGIMGMLGRMSGTSKANSSKTVLPQTKAMSKFELDQNAPLPTSKLKPASMATEKETETKGVAQAVALIPAVEPTTPASPTSASPISASPTSAPAVVAHLPTDDQKNSAASSADCARDSRASVSDMNEIKTVTTAPSMEFIKACGKDENKEYTLDQTLELSTNMDDNSLVEEEPESEHRLTWEEQQYVNSLRHKLENQRKSRSLFR